MASVNKVILVGNCGRDPEIRYLPSGQAVANVSVATSTRRKDKTSGETVEDTQWHRVTFYDRLAEIAGEYVKKGRPIYVEGRRSTASTPARTASKRTRWTSLPPSCNCSAAAKAWAAAVVVTTKAPPSSAALPRQLARHRHPRNGQRRPSRPRGSAAWMTIFRSRSKLPAHEEATA